MSIFVPLCLVSQGHNSLLSLCLVSIRHNDTSTIASLWVDVSDVTLEALCSPIVPVSETSSDVVVTPEKVDTTVKPDINSATSLHQVFYDPKDESFQFQNAKKKSGKLL